MAYAVEGFFKNGGQRCYVARIVRKGDNVAANATATIGNMLFTAIGKGSWGNKIAVRIDDASLFNPKDPEKKNTDLFKLTIIYSKNAIFETDKETADVTEADAKKTGKKKDKETGTAEASGTEKGAAAASEIETKKALIDILKRSDVVEIFDNISILQEADDYFIKKVSKLSNLVDVAWANIEAPKRPENTSAATLFTALSQGNEGKELCKEDFNGSAKAGERTGLSAFEEIKEISIVYAPDLHKLQPTVMGQLWGDLKAHCESQNRFVILDTPPNLAEVSEIWPPAEAVSKYAAYYYPWIKTYDPLTKDLKFVPPGGHIAGIYARSDVERGVHKAPANEIVIGASEVEFTLTKGAQDILNPRGVNCIRSFQGRGILVWGARTTIPDALWKYINVRRLFIFVEESIKDGTQWVVFEPNNEKLWARVKQTITQFLTRVWKDGALMGTTPEEAFFVKCDRTTMTQDDIDNGRLIVQIGIAPTKPAEFVIFRIAQWAGGSSATE